MIALSGLSFHYDGMGAECNDVLVAQTPHGRVVLRHITNDLSNRYENALSIVMGTRKYLIDGQDGQMEP